MIALLSGTVHEKTPNALIVLVGGVGYTVAVLSSLWNKVKEGEAIEIKIFHHVSSETSALYGFREETELKYFKLLLTVPSVGPRTALGVLNAASPKVLAQAVADNDVKVLTKVSGVGKKTAERVLVELKEKIDATPSAQPVGELQTEVISVLVNLGYSKAQAQEAVRTLPTDVGSPEEAVRHLLQTRS